MELLAISGGPDSMVLLHQKHTKKIVVAHVNYHLRASANEEQALVENYCAKYQIPCEVLELSGVKPTGNFQAWARAQRYAFFAQIYQKYDCSKLLLAHHKDDFLETALMQFQSQRKPQLYGMLAKNELYKMRIERPFLTKYWKAALLQRAAQNDLPYKIDESNQCLIYTRNRIRADLKSWPLAQKKATYQWFIATNKVLAQQQRRVQKLFRKWKQQQFNIRNFHTNLLANELIYMFIYDQADKIKLTSGKINAIKAFINAPRGNTNYQLNRHYTILKKNQKIAIKSIDTTPQAT